MNLEAFYPAKQWKFCPYCSSPNIEWKNTTHCMKCNNCTRNFYINAASAVIAIITNSDGEILLTERKFDPHKGMLDLPGGFVDLGERGEDAAIREVKEELNLNVLHVKYLDSMPNRYLFNNIVYFTLDLVFECKIQDLNEINAADDVKSFSFKKPESISLERIGLESVRKIIAKIKNNEYVL